MRTLALPSSLLAPAVLCAQIVIGPNDMPSAGDIIHYRTTTGQGLQPQNTGADYTWDFTQLGQGTAGADTCVSVASTPLLYQFFFNNGILYPEHQANYAVKGFSFGVQGVSLEDVYNYYKKGPTGFRDVGFGATINGLPASVRRQPVDWIHRFPMAYGDQDTSYSTFNITVPTLGHYGQTQWRYNQVDGWGTLLLPGGQEFEVLRVRSTLQQRDTLFVDQFGFGFGINRPNTVEYKWLAQGMDAPVLQITTVAGQSATVRYYYQVNVGVADAPADRALPLYPNPADDRLHVALPEGFSGLLRVVDAVGREVLAQRTTTTGGPPMLDITALAPGSYLLLAEGESLRWSARFVKR